VQDSAAYLAEHFHEVPALVLPFFEGPLDGQPFSWVNMAFASTMPAVWSFMLAARVRGLDATLTTLTGLFLDDANRILGVPEGYTHCATIPVAYYLGDSFQPGRRLSVDEVTFHDTWGERGYVSRRRPGWGSGARRVVRRVRLASPSRLLLRL